MRKVIKNLAIVTLATVITVTSVPVEAQAATSIIKNNWTSYFGITDGWNEGAEGSLTSNSKTDWIASMNSIGYGGVWGAQVKQENISFTKGQTYKISFTLNSTNINKWVVFKIEGDDPSALKPDQAILFKDWIQLKAGEEKSFTYTYTADKNYKGHLSLIFGVGGEFGDRDDERNEGLYNGLSALPDDVDAMLSTNVVCSKFSMSTIETTLKNVKSPKKKQAKVTIKKAAGVKGYAVQYSLKKNFKGAKQVKVTKTTATIKKLKSGKKYYFRVKTYNKNGVLSSTWSKAKSVKIK